MVQLTHRIEGMRSVIGPGRDSLVGFFVGRIGVAEAGMNSNFSGMLNRLNRSGKLGSDGHHPQRALGCLPVFLEHLWRWRHKVFRRMHSSFRMTDEWSLEVNAK